MLIAQITDTHIKADGKLAYGIVDTAAYLARAVEALNALDPLPDIALVTGDLVDLGRPVEYARLRALLAPLRMPYFLLAGNHDERAALKAGFSDHAYLGASDGFVHYTLEDWPCRIIALDTVVPGKGGGTLCDARISWVAARLREQPMRPTVIAMHHPPFRTGIAHMDEQGLDNAAALRDVVALHPNVERLICGHLHRPIQARFAGTIASTAPSVAHQVALDLRPDGPSRFVMEPPGYQLHHWTDADGLRSHTAFIGDFAGPYPFFDQAGRLIDM